MVMYMLQRLTLSQYFRTNDSGAHRLLEYFYAVCPRCNTKELPSLRLPRCQFLRTISTGLQISQLLEVGTILHDWRLG